MVLKRSKLGINSGNSFGVRHYRLQAAKQAMLAGSLSVFYRIPIEEYRACQNKKELSETAQRRITSVLRKLGYRDGRASSTLSELAHYSGKHAYAETTTTLSLNKHRRWELADRVVSAIESDTFGRMLPGKSDNSNEEAGVKRARTAAAKRSKPINSANGQTADCAISVARFRMPHDGGRSYDPPCTCVLYANSDAPRAMVSFTESGAQKRKEDSQVYGNFYDMVKNAYRESTPAQDSNGKVANGRQHNAHYRGVQRPARKQRPRERVVAQSEDKQDFYRNRPIQRPEVSFAVGEPRRMTTERCYQFREVDRSRFRSPTRRQRRADLQAMLDEDYDLFNHPLDLEEVEVEHLADCYSPLCDSDWSVQSASGRESPVEITVTFGTYESDSAIELGESEAESSDSASLSLALLPSSRRACGLDEFLVLPHKQTRRSKKPRHYVDALDNDTQKCVRIELPADRTADSFPIASTAQVPQDVPSDVASSNSAMIDTLCLQWNAERERSLASQLLVLASELEAETLAERFGEKYAEAQSTPRVLLLELADDKSSELQLEASLLLHVKQSTESNDMDYVQETSLNVNLRLIANVNAQVMSKLQAEVDNLVAVYSCSAPVSNLLQFVGHVTELVRAQVADSDERCETAAGCSWRRSVETESVPLHSVPTKLAKCATRTQFASRCEEQSCAICYCDTEQPIRLAPCGHTFCADCLTRYVVTLACNVPPRSDSIDCAAYGCKSPLDVATLSSLLPASLFYMYKRRLQELQVAQRRNGFCWCPNDKCAALLRQKQKQSEWQAEAHCAKCETHFCFACGGEAHFPTTCSGREKFVEAMQRRKQLNKRVQSDFSYGVQKVESSETSYTAKVKHCPRCRLVMEKGEGCQHMTCRCHHQFCWVCLRDWTRHCEPDFPWDCENHKYELDEMELVDDPHALRRNQEEHYRQALMFRSACCDQWTRLRELRVLQVKLRNLMDSAPQDLVLALTDSLQHCGAALETLVDSLRYLCHLHAAVFVWKRNVATGNPNGGRKAKQLDVFTVVRKLQEPLDALRFGLTLMMPLLDELLNCEKLAAVLDVKSVYSLALYIKKCSEKKQSKLTSLTDVCRRQLMRCRALSYHSFGAIGNISAL